jgi:hypothetical protein
MRLSFWPSGSRLEKERAAGQDVRGVRAAIRLAEEMGALLG